jgi:hypothetical protein
MTTARPGTELHETGATRLPGQTQLRNHRELRSDLASERDYDNVPRAGARNRQTHRRLLIVTSRVLVPAPRLKGSIVHVVEEEDIGLHSLKLRNDPCSGRLGHKIEICVVHVAPTSSKPADLACCRGCHERPDIPKGPTTRVAVKPMGSTGRDIMAPILGPLPGGHHQSVPAPCSQCHGQLPALHPRTSLRPMTL